MSSIEHGVDSSRGILSYQVCVRPLTAHVLKFVMAIPPLCRVQVVAAIVA